MHAHPLDRRLAPWALAAVAASPAPLPEQPAEPQRGPELVPEPPPRPSRRGLGWLMLLLGVGLGALAWQQSRTGLGGPGGPAGGPTVYTVEATRGAFNQTIRLSGSIRAETFAPIRAPQISMGRRGGGASGGAMTLIQMAAAGTKVQRDEVVAEFDRQSQQLMIDDQEAAVVQSEAMLHSREADLVVAFETKKQEMVAARAEYEKAKLDLRTAEVKSEIEAEVLKNTMEEAEASFKQLELEVGLLEGAHQAAIEQVKIDLKQEEIDLRRAQRNAERMEIVTPINGIVVLETTFRGGSFAQVANGDEVRPGTLFMQVVDPTSMILEARVNQADSQRIRVGQLAEVRLDAYPDATWPGRVRSISAMTGDSGGGGGGRFRSTSGDYVREISVTIEIEGQDPRIIPDLSASADVALERFEDVVTAPREALTREGEEWFVRVSDGQGGATPQAVEVEAFTDTRAIIGAGLRGQEKLVVGSTGNERAQRARLEQ